MALTRRPFLTFLNFNIMKMASARRHATATPTWPPRCRAAPEPTQVEVIKLNDELAEITDEADYMKEKEVGFHRKAERIM